MQKRFQSNDRPLADLLTEAARGDLQLPDFQRGWVWDDEHIRSLLASLSLAYPIGAVMVLEAGNPSVRFRPRALQGATFSSDTEPRYLLLDGQQRMTSLYLALRGDDPVTTRDSRNDEIKVYYYVDINLALAPDSDREDAIIAFDADRRIRHRKDVVRDCSSRALEVQEECFPLRLLLDDSGKTDWMLHYLEAGDDRQQRIDRWKHFQREFIDPIAKYELPVIKLFRDTPKEAVCQVFEKVNTGGVSLTVFELLTATFAADDFNLRDDWQGRRARIREARVLHEIRSTDFLQVIALLHSWDRREQARKEGVPLHELPGVSCKRRDILRLELSAFRAWADKAEKGLMDAAAFLGVEFFYRSRDVPYRAQIVPLAAILTALGARAEPLAVRNKLIRWFWCGVLGELYGSATESRFAADLVEVLAWVDGGAEPRTVNDASFQAGRLLSLRTRNSAAYKGLAALALRAGAQDFATGKPVSADVYWGSSIDIHHIFPKRWCDANAVAGLVRDCAVNKTPIAARTNSSIGGSAPSIYTKKLEAGGIAPAELDRILRSHWIDSFALRKDDFAAVFNARFEELCRLISEAMGKPVVRTADRDESPYFNAEVDQAAAIQRIITSGETELVEFKSTARVNLHTGTADPKMEDMVVKSIAALLNTRGGNLLIGVRDDGTIQGLDVDYATTRGGDRDGFQLWFAQLLENAFDKPVTTWLRVHFAQLDGKPVCRVQCTPASQPVFATLQSDPKPKPQRFYIRDQTRTVALDGQDRLTYQSRRWG